MRKKEIGDQATRLIEKGKAIQDRQKRGKERRRDRRNYNKFRQVLTSIFSVPSFGSTYW